MAENDLTKVARIAAGSVMGATYKDKDGKQQVIRPTGDANYLDLSGVITNSGSTGGGTAGGGTTGGNTSTPVTQLPSTVNLFSGSAVGNILLAGPTPNYDNVQDGLLLTLSSMTSITANAFGDIASSATVRADLSSIGLKQIKIPKEKLVVNSSFDISDQLSQYIGKAINVQCQNSSRGPWNDMSSAYSSYGLSFSVLSFGGATIKVLPNTALSMNLIINVQEKSTMANTPNRQGSFSIPVIQVNDYKN